MFKGQLGISAAILAILVTVGAFFLVTGDSNTTADKAAKARTESAYHAVRSVLALDAQASRTLAHHYAKMSTAYFKAVRRYRSTVSQDMAKAASGMAEGWTPDFIAVVNTKRIVIWSELNSTVTKPGTPVDYATNRVVNAKFATKALTGRAASHTGPFPFKSVVTSSLKGVAVPLLGAGKVPVGALILAWKGKTEDRELKSHGETFRDKVDVVNVLLPRQKITRNLGAMLANEFPEDLKKTLGIKAAFIGLLDRHGILVARNDQSGMFLGTVLKPKSLALQTARAQHHTTTEVWLKSVVQDVATDGKKASDVRPEIFRVGVAPVMNEENKLQGMLLLAWELGDVHATRMKRLSGAEVVYVHKKTLSTSTLKSVTASMITGVPRSDQGPGEWKAPTRKSLSVGSDTYYAAAAAFPSGAEFSFVVLSSVTAAKAPYGYARIMVLVLGGIMVICILLVSWMLRRYFILPLSELEKGVADIVAGNMEHTFGVPSRETEGLAYSLNVLMAQLLGRPEPGEEEDEEGESTGGSQMLFSLGPLPDRAYRPGDSQLIPRLDENKDTYYQRIFQEYLVSMQELGEDTAGFDIGAFRRKLEVNERMICARLKCSEVRFSVVTGDEEVVLQPYPVA